MSIIETKRLLLRPYEAEDKDDYLNLVTDPEVMGNIDEGVVSIETANEWWERLISRNDPAKGIRWYASWIPDSRFIGHAMINQTRPEDAWELGYILPKTEWGKDFATEIARALADYSRDEMGLNEIYGTDDEDHEPSINVLKKAGMTFSGYDFHVLGRYLVYVLKHES